MRNAACYGGVSCKAGTNISIGNYVRSDHGENNFGKCDGVELDLASRKVSFDRNVGNGQASVTVHKQNICTLGFQLLRGK